GIRDFHVTGVQTCALPICDAVVARRLRRRAQRRRDTERATHLVLHLTDSHPHRPVTLPAPPVLAAAALLVGLPRDRLRVPVLVEIGRASCRESGGIARERE